MHRDQVWELCKTIAPPYAFEPILILAICEQESRDPQNPLEYRDRAARLEQGFYINYVERENLATTSEILLASSYGLTQMMGLSLRAVGYFDWWFAEQTAPMQTFLGNPFSEIAIPKAINAYMINPPWQVERGCMWLKKKREKTGGDAVKMLRYWNGDISGAKHYAEDVLGRRDKLRGIYLM
ncbi:MAG: hypothetical protein AB1428_12900 [Bacteroidota bacterium]